MRLRDHYDWVVLGDHPAAWAAAGLACRLGMSVLILPDAAPTLRTGVTPTGQVFDPESPFLCGLGSSNGSDGALRRLIGAEALTSEEWARFCSEPISDQLMAPGVRLPMGGDTERFWKACERESAQPEAAAELRRQVEAWSTAWSEARSAWPNRLIEDTGRNLRLRALPSNDALLAERLKGLSDGKARERALQAAWERCAREPWVRTVLRAVEGASDQGAVSFVQWFAALTDLQSGAVVEGGRSALRSVLSVAARRAGAQVIELASCSRVLVEETGLRGIELADGGGITVAGQAWVCTELETVRGWLGSTTVRGQRLREAAEPSGWTFTIAMTAYREAIPAGMGRRAVWAEEGAPSLELVVADPAQYGVEEPEHVLVFLRTELPWSESSLSLEEQRRIAGRMFRKACEIFPFLEFQVVRVYPDFRESASDFKEVYSFGSLAQVPASLRVWRKGSGAGEESGIAGLYVASSEAYPAWGEVGAWLACARALARPAMRVGLKSVLPAPPS